MRCAGRPVIVRESASGVTFGPFRFHAETGSVSRSGETITLTPKASAVHMQAGDVEAARPHFELLAGAGFSGIPRDGLWLISMSQVAELCAASGGRRPRPGPSARPRRRHARRRAPDRRPRGDWVLSDV
jgi:hypothetical protein